MPRIVGVDVPNNKPLWIALTYIHGIGRHICEREITADGREHDGREVLGGVLRLRVLHALGRSQRPDGRGLAVLVGSDHRGGHRAAAACDCEIDVDPRDTVTVLVFDLGHEWIGQGLIDESGLTTPADYCDPYGGVRIRGCGEGGDDGRVGDHFDGDFLLARCGAEHPGGAELTHGI